MLIQIDYHNGVPIYRQVLDQLRQQIVSGQLSEGQQLVSVRDLASELKVNPMTISKAYALLEMEGLVERRRGIGLFVAKVPKQRQSEIKTRIVQQILDRAVSTAIQLGIPQEQFQQLIARLFEKYDRQERQP